MGGDLGMGCMTTEADHQLIEFIGNRWISILFGTYEECRKQEKVMKALVLPAVAPEMKIFSIAHAVDGYWCGSPIEQFGDGDYDY